MFFSWRTLFLPFINLGGCSYVLKSIGLDLYTSFFVLSGSDHSFSVNSVPGKMSLSRWVRKKHCSLCVPISGLEQRRKNPWLVHTFLKSLNLRAFIPLFCRFIFLCFLLPLFSSFYSPSLLDFVPSFLLCLLFIRHLYSKLAGE